MKAPLIAVFCLFVVQTTFAAGTEVSVPAPKATCEVFTVGSTSSEQHSLVKDVPLKLNVGAVTQIYSSHHGTYYVIILPDEETGKVMLELMITNDKGHEAGSSESLFNSIEDFPSSFRVTGPNSTDIQEPPFSILSCKISK